MKIFIFYGKQISQILSQDKIKMDKNAANLILTIIIHIKIGMLT